MSDEYRVIDDEGTVCMVGIETREEADEVAAMLDRTNEGARHRVQHANVTWKETSPLTDYRIALRPNDEGLLDDVAVAGVDMFRMEQMSDNDWWLCCYLKDEDYGNRISWSAYFDKKTKNLVMTTTEYPNGVAYEQGSMSGD